MIAPLLGKHQMADLLGKPVSFVEENCRLRRWDFSFVGGEYKFTEAQAQTVIDSFAVAAATPEPERVEQPAPKPPRQRREKRAVTNPSGVIQLKAQPERSRLYKQGVA
ncbi:hypothetical protein ACFWYW_19785 [Nonomuraea sp. NPDC059023]|uniref:hypothetical protein n=1 Tax=unclassified Nonomuraea TaxID=2593643 RepID=UPI0036C79FD2